MISMHILAALIFFFFLLQKHITRDFSLTKISIERPLFALLFIIILTSFFTTYFFNTQLELHKVITYLIIFIVTSTLFQTETRLKLLAYWVIICAFLLSVIGIARNLPIPLFDKLWPHAEFSTFVSKNAFQAYINAGLSLTIALVLFSGIWLWTKALLSIAACFLIIAGALSYDKGGWLGFVALLLFIFVFAGYEGLLKGRFWHVLLSLTILLWIIGLSVRLEGIIRIFVPAIILRPEDAFNIGYETTLWTRISMWRSALKMVVRYPILGVGLGNFKLVYPAFKDSIITNFVGYAHQDYLQFAVETGLAGLASLSWLAFSFFKKIITEVKFKQPSFLTGLKVGGLAGVFSMAIHSLYEFTLHTPSVALVFVLLCSGLMALYLMGYKAKTVVDIRGMRLSYLASAIVMIFYISYLGMLFLADRNYNEGLLAMARFSFNEAEEHFKKALSYVPHNAEYTARLGELYAHRSRFMDDQHHYQKKAIALYKKAVSINPREGNLHIEAGIINARYGNKEEAKEEFVKALTLDPHNAFYRSILTEYAIAWGELDIAEKGFRK